MLRVIRNSRVSSSARVYPGSVFKNSSIGSYSYLSYFSFVNQTTIGRYCSIGMSFKSGLGSHPAHFLSTSPAFFSPAPPVMHPAGTTSAYTENHPVLIGNDVWIGAGVTILDGVKIGDGAIVGAGCVVTKDVAPYSIVGGIPGQVIGSRFDECLTERLLSLAWWDYNLSEVPQGKVKSLFSGNLTKMKVSELERICQDLPLLIDN